MIDGTARRTLGWAVAIAVALIAGPARGDEEPAPRIRFDSEQILLTEVTGPQAGRLTFEFQNVGTAPLEILDLQSSCGCIAAMLSRPVVPPGERGAVLIQLDRTRVGERRTKIVTVYSNDPQRPVVYLKVTAEVPHLVTLSDAVLNFGVVPLGESRERTFIAFHTPGAPLELERVTAASRLLSASWTHSADEEQPAFVLTTRFNAGASAGTFTDTLRLEFVNPPLLVEVPVRAQIRGSVLATPAVLGLGVVRAGSAPERTVALTAPTLQHFTVDRVESTSAHIIPAVTASAPGTYAIAVRVGPQAPSGPLKALLRVYTNARDLPLLEVPVAAIVR